MTDLIDSFEAALEAYLAALLEDHGAHLHEHSRSIAGGIYAPK